MPERVRPISQRLDTPKDTVPSIEGAPLTAEKASNVYMHSFAPSQNSIWLQKKMFEYVHAIHPDWRFPDEMKAELLPNVTKKIERYLQYSAPEPSRNPKPQKKLILHSYKGTRDVADEVKARLDDMQAILNNPYTRTIDDVITTITESMITQDFNYLAKMEKTRNGWNGNATPRGRVRSNPDVTNPLHDPWLSFVCYFSLTEDTSGKRPTTGSEEFDQMFADMATFIKSGKPARHFDWATDAQFSFILDLHDKTHPHNPIRW